jgi:ABC-2 type transport system ATP-binding protein
MNRQTSAPGQVPAVVRTEGLVKSFGQTRALDGLDLEVAAGAVHGFLGPNGSGKSTTLRILLGLLRHDSGRVELLGGDPWTDAVSLHRRLAYVPGEVNLWPNLTGGEVIDLLGRLRGSGDDRRRVELIDRFGLDPSKKCRSYSKGNRQKVVLIAALIADVELLLLDEPTAGLDPLMEAEFQGVVRERTGEGTTVLLSSHILGEVEALCDSVSIIRDGRTVLSGTLDDVRRRGRTTVIARIRGPADEILGITGVTGSVTGGELRCEAPTGSLDKVLAALAAAGVTSVEARPPTLEELFLSEYGEPTPEVRRQGRDEGVDGRNAAAVDR